MIRFLFFAEPYNMKVNISASLIQIVMNYPASKCHLGVIRGEEVFITAQVKIRIIPKFNYSRIQVFL